MLSGTIIRFFCLVVFLVWFLLCFGFFVCLFGLCFCFCFSVFQDRVSLYSPGCPGTHFVDQTGLELRNPPASGSRVLGLKACATTPGTLNSLYDQYLQYETLWLMCSSKCVPPASDTDTSILWLLARHIVSLIKCLFKSFAYFWVALLLCFKRFFSLLLVISLLVFETGFNV
jgi:hypothetical protein